MSRRSILRAGEGDVAADLPGRGRFHIMADGRLFIFHHARARTEAGDMRDENRLVELRPDGSLGPVIPVPLKQPLGTFFTAGVRAGCAPSDRLDVLGAAGDRIRYARIRLAE